MSASITQARRAGRMARWRNKPASSNPNVGKSAAAWLQGWTEAEHMEPPADLEEPEPLLTKHGGAVRGANGSMFQVNPFWFRRDVTTTWR